MEMVNSPKLKTKQQMKQKTKDLRRTLLFQNTIISQIKKKYQNMHTAKDRQVISKVVAGKLLKKYRLLDFARKEFGFSPKLMKTNKTRATKLQYTQQIQCNKISKEVEKKIISFLERDDNSRITTGKKETVTKSKKKMQKRFLVESMRTLHQKFKMEHPEVAVSYSEFCKRRPFWIIKPTIKDRDTCLCKIHANLQFMADRLFYHKVIKSAKLSDLMESVACTNATKECMYRECPDCKDKELLTSDFDAGEQTWWFEWRSKVEEREKTKKDGTKEKFKVHLTAKEKVNGTVQTLLEDFSEQLKKKMGKHIFNIKHQYSALRALKENMRGDEMVLQIDFAENYLCKYGNQIQAVHFGDSHQQATLNRC